MRTRVNISVKSTTQSANSSKEARQMLLRSLETRIPSQLKVRMRNQKRAREKPYRETSRKREKKREKSPFPPYSSSSSLLILILKFLML